MTSESISIVVPAFNEEENIAAVVEDCRQTLDQIPGNHEIIVVDDASTDQTAQLLGELTRTVPSLHVLRNEQNLGCHPSVRRGFDQAKGDWLLFLPADRQIRADSLHTFLTRTADAEMICSYRRNRADPLYRVLISRAYNFAIRCMLGVGFRDFDSSVLVRREAYAVVAPDLVAETASLSVELLIRMLAGGYRVAEVEIDHYPRVAGRATGLNWRDATRVPVHLVRAARIAREMRRIAQTRPVVG